MFRFLAVLGMLALVAVAAFHMQEDYRWAGREIASGMPGGWQLVARQNGHKDSVYPWTLVVTPVTALYFMHPDRIERHGEALFLAPVTAKTYDYTHRSTRQHLFWVGLNLEKNRIAIFKADKDGLVVIQKSVEWVPIQPGSPGEGLAAYVRRHPPAPFGLQSNFRRS